MSTRSRPTRSAGRVRAAPLPEVKVMLVKLHERMEVLSVVEGALREMSDAVTVEAVVEEVELAMTRSRQRFPAV